MKLVDIAHRYWKEIAQPGDTVIDATLGNGYDTLFLARHLEGKGKIYAYDIQKEALFTSQALFEKELSEEERKPIQLHHSSHIQFDIPAAKLVVYNLGYLPRGNKNITTHWETTEKSLKAALALIEEKGALSIMAYVGHPQGKEEEEKIKLWAMALPTSEWNVLYHQWINKKEAPSLFLIFRENRISGLNNP